MSPYQEPQRPSPQAAISIADVLRGMMRRKLSIIAFGLLCTAGGTFLVNMLSPVYSTEAQVLIQNLETPFDRVRADEQGGRGAVDDREVATQISVLKSADLGRRVVAALGLEGVPEFNPLLKGVGPLGRIKIALGFKDDPRLKTPEQRALDRYSDQLNVYQVPDSNVVAVKYSSGDPEIAAKVANTLTETYVAWTRENQSQPTQRAREWLSAQIETLRQKLAKSEQDVEEFRARAGLLMGATMTLGTQEISELNTQITVANAAAAEARAKANAIRDLLQARGSVDSASEVLASSVVQRLKEQRTQAASKVAELSPIYLPGHPKMISAQNELANIDKQIRAEALKVVSGLEEQASVAEAREESLRQTLEGMKTKESGANLDDVKLKALEREAAADRALLEQMLARFAEASAKQELSALPGFAVVIQSASVPATPSFPKRGPMALLIAIAAFATAVSFAFLVELMNAAARIVAVEDRSRMAPSLPASAHPSTWNPAPAAQVPPPLAALPRIAGELVAPAVLGGSAAAEAFGAIADWTAALRQSLGAGVAGVTSLGGYPGETSCAAIGLARAISNRGKRVIVVDLSQIASWVGALSGVGARPGLAELVTGAADFTKVIARDSGTSVHVLMGGLDKSPRAEQLIHERLEPVLSALAQSYDHVIANLGEAHRGTPAILRKCRVGILLAPENRGNDAATAIQALRANGLLAAGHVVLAEEFNAAMPDFARRPAAA